MLAAAIDALPGWRAVTDLTTAIGVVPLVAVGPGGAFAIETAEASQVAALCDVPERWLIHAWAQAKHLERRRLGAAVTPVVVLTGTPADGPTGRRRGVRLLPDAMLGPYLASQPVLLSDGEADLLGRRLADAPLPFVLAA